MIKYNKCHSKISIIAGNPYKDNQQDNFKGSSETMDETIDIEEIVRSY